MDCLNFRISKVEISKEVWMCPYTRSVLGEEGWRGVGGVISFCVKLPFVLLMLQIYICCGHYVLPQPRVSPKNQVRLSPKGLKDPKGLSIIWSTQAVKTRLHRVQLIPSLFHHRYACYPFVISKKTALETSLSPQYCSPIRPSHQLHQLEVEWDVLEWLQLSCPQSYTHCGKIILSSS